MRLSGLSKRMRYVRARYRRTRRMLFPSPAEMKFIEIMGGRTWAVMAMRPNKQYRLCIVLSMGRVLRANNIRREIRVGAMHVDFASVDPYTKKAIEVDGAPYHDVVADMRRDEYLAGYGWQVLHIPAQDLWRRPEYTKARVLRFLAT